MRRWRTLMAVMGALVVPACAGAGPALAAGNAVINDCQSNGKLTQSYTTSELRQALAVMPPSVKEYSNCQDVINQAILVAVQSHTGKSGGPGKSSGGSFLPTPVIVILVLLVLAAVTFGAIAFRRRQQGEGPS